MSGNQKQFIAERLEEAIKPLQKAAVGDFSELLEIPEREDEFTPLFVAINLMIEDLRELQEIKDKNEKRLAAAAEKLEKTVEKRTAELEEKVQDLEKVQDVLTGRELKMVELKKEIEKLRKNAAKCTCDCK